MTALNLDRTQRENFTRLLVNQITDGTLPADADECFFALMEAFGEGYMFDSMDSEVEGIIDDALRTTHDAADYNRSVDAFHGIEYQQPTAERHDAFYWLSEEEQNAWHDAHDANVDDDFFSETYERRVMR